MKDLYTRRIRLLDLYTLNLVLPDPGLAGPYVTTLFSIERLEKLRFSRGRESLFSINRIQRLLFPREEGISLFSREEEHSYSLERRESLLVGYVHKKTLLVGSVRLPTGRAICS